MSRRARNSLSLSDADGQYGRQQLTSRFSSSQVDHGCWVSIGLARQTKVQGAVGHLLPAIKGMFLNS